MVWSSVLLTISENPHLEKIELWNPFQTDNAAILGTGLFLTEARSHQRLVDLIKAGTLVFNGTATVHLFHDSDADNVDKIIQTHRSREGTHRWHLRPGIDLSRACGR